MWGYLAVPLVLMASAVLVAFAASLTGWLTNNRIRLRGWHIVYSKRPHSPPRRGFEVKLTPDEASGLAKKEDDHG